VFTVLPFSEAVTVTDWLDENVPAEAVNEAELEPVLTVTNFGIDKAELLSERVTTALEVAVQERVTVQVALPPEFKVAGEHCRDEMTTVAEIVIVVVADLLLSEAVIVTD
jgi:hypothetical protein